MFNLFALNAFDPTPFFPASGQTIAFDWFSIVYLVILAICVLVSIKRGFMLSLLSLCKGLLVFVAAFLLAKPVGNLMFNWGLGSKLIGSYEPWLIGKNAEVFNAMVTAETASDAISSGLTALKIPALLANTLLKLILPFVPAEGEVALSSVFAQGMATYTLIAIAFVALLIVLGIAVFFLKKIAEKLSEISFIKWVDKLLGAVIGLVIGCLVICIITYGLSFLITLPQCSDYITGVMKLGDDTVWTISKAVYEYNLVGKLFELYL